ncbi:MAG: trehalose-phosphatase [Bryobacteraceae bacterium]
MSQPPADLASEIEARARSACTISLFLDFDGTLVPISGDPSVPILSPGAAATLRLLAGRHHLVTTIISGRAIEDLYARVRLQGLIYAGNHGLEIFGRQLRFVEPVASERRDALERLCEEIEAKVQPVPGTLVERKGLTAAVHYRQAAESSWPAIEQAVYSAVARRGALFHINRGRKVFDIMPRTDWHKGAAVEWINSHLAGKLFTIYLGDDVTDEDAFSVLPNDVTVKVGPVTATCARFRLSGPAAVQEFLLWLANIGMN